MNQFYWKIYKFDVCKYFLFVVFLLFCLSMGYIIFCLSMGYIIFCLSMGYIITEESYIFFILNEK